MARICPRIDCPQLAPCPIHPPDKGRTRRSPRARGYDSAHDREAKALQGGPCELRVSPDCTGIATEGHHPIGVGRGPQQLLGACAPCNQAAKPARS